jgi:hypothetical protein
MYRNQILMWVALAMVPIAVLPTLTVVVLPRPGSTSVKPDTDEVAWCGSERLAAPGPLLPCVGAERGGKRRAALALRGAS